MTQQVLDLEQLIRGMTDDQQMEQSFAVVPPDAVGRTWEALHRVMHAKVAAQRGTPVEQSPGDCGAGHAVMPRDAGVLYLTASIQAMADVPEAVARLVDVRTDLLLHQDCVLLLGFMVWAPL